MCTTARFVHWKSGTKPIPPSLCSCIVKAEHQLPIHHHTHTTSWCRWLGKMGKKSVNIKSLDPKVAQSLASECQFCLCLAVLPTRAQSVFHPCAWKSVLLMLPSLSVWCVSICIQFNGNVCKFFDDLHIWRCLCIMWNYTGCFLTIHFQLETYDLLHCSFVNRVFLNIVSVQNSSFMLAINSKSCFTNNS